MLLVVTIKVRIFDFKIDTRVKDTNLTIAVSEIFVKKYLTFRF